MSGGCREGVCRLVGVCGVVWRVSAGCLKGVWRVSMMLSGDCLHGVRRVSGGCLNGVLMVSVGLS